MDKSSKKNIYLEKTIKGKKHKYTGEFYTSKKYAETAKKSLRNDGFDVSVRKVKPTKKELDKHEKDTIGYLGVRPKRNPSKIYRIFIYKNKL